ncbi:MAG TPA: phosphomannomutase [Holosporales bacterium]|nr:phosphomannomutase [Holosporales bacterium]
MTQLACFKAYDIRGSVPDELNVELVYKIGIAYAIEMKTTKVIVGYDGRLESPEIVDALIKGLNSQNVEVINIGLCGTEEVYFHTFHQEKNGVDGGIMVTASHNPKGYNGLKMVSKGAYPISGDTGLKCIHDRVISMDSGPFLSLQAHNSSVEDYTKEDYIKHLLSYVDRKALKALKIVVNPGNGTAGLALKELEKHLPFEFIYLHENVDGTFPNGIPNPLLPENRASTQNAVQKHKADFGIAWDGDFDRCFFFDENARFIEGYYIVGLLAQAFLQKHKGATIIHDPRLIWNTIDITNTLGGKAIQSKTGHSFIKQIMRQEDAVYGGEMSAHHYFKDFAYCDSGMIPWLLVSELISIKNTPLSKMVDACIAAYPCSGEINYTVVDTKKTLDKIRKYFIPLNPIVDTQDGLSMSFVDWRFNVRASNTEPLLRLNIEAKNNIKRVQEKVLEIEQLIKG